MATSTVQKLPWFPWIGKRPFYGWVIVAVGTVTHFSQGIVGTGFGTYFTYLQREFGWSRAILASPRSVTQVEGAILGPIEGYLVDKLGPRAMVATGVFIMGLGLILFGLIHSLWMFFLSNIIIAIGTGFQGTLVQTVAVNHWFRRKRSMATAIILLGITMAGIAGIPTLVFLQGAVGWRNSAFLTALLVWAVGLPLSMLLRRSPEPYGLLPDGDTPAALGTSVSARAGRRLVVEEYDFTLREALRTRSFWLLAIGIATGNMGMGALQTHVFLQLEEGVSLAPPTAALVWTVASMSNIPSRFVGGFFGDRLPKNIMLGSAMAVMALSVLLLGLATSLSLALGFAVFYGLGWGTRGVLMNSIQGDYFGRKSQGIIRGWLQLIGLPLTIVAPVLVGYMADVQGTYRWAFIIMSFTILVGAIITFLATPPKPPVQRKTFMAE